MSTHPEAPERSSHLAGTTEPVLTSTDAAPREGIAQARVPEFASSPFESLRAPARALQERQGASASTPAVGTPPTTEPYSIRVSPDVKRRFSEAIAKDGGRPALFFEKLLDLYDETAGGADTGLSEPFARVRRNVEGHVRALVVTLAADLRDLEETFDLQESEAADLTLQLHELQTRTEKERAQFEVQRVRFAEEHAAWIVEREAAKTTRVRLEEEIGEMRASLRALNQSLTEVRAKAEAAAGQRERITLLEQKLAETEQRAARAALHREETELKLARALEDVDRTRKTLDVNEVLRVRQHQTAEEERKALSARAAAERERLEATVERLHARIAEMTRESGK
ncbi:MAG: hypothetical protein ING65_18595 [Rhodocyclaceae bacterium]|jgi:hypothetical protein|nr:hypothetical protein [Rhodocyclaceae bacterium]